MSDPIKTTDWIQASAAIINVIVVIVLSIWNLIIVKQQQKKENERFASLTKNTAGVLTFRIATIAVGLERISGITEVNTFAKLNLSKGLPDEMIVQYLHVEITRKVFDLWTAITEFQEEIEHSLRHNASEDIAKLVKTKALEYFTRLMDLKKSLEELSGYKF